MKGIVYNLLEECVSRDYGADTWDDLLDSTGLDGVYTSLGSYPDQDLFALVAATSDALGQPADVIIRWFGRNAVPLLASQYPQFFEPHRTTRAFVLTLNDIIHPEVRKIYPGADVPVFDFGSSSDVLLMSYSSPRKLCAFAEGLLDGAALHYGEQIVIEQPRCMLRGDDRCVLEISVQ
jgi:predicted hydrocarbon binding protein